MRVYYSRVLPKVVAGTDDWLSIRGRLAADISETDEAALRTWPGEIAAEFNNFAATAQGIVEYWSGPVIFPPDEFKFEFGIEALDRLSREMFIRLMPLYASGWETRNVPISDLWIGGGEETLEKGERPSLTQRIQEIWSWPVSGKVFVLGEDISNSTSRAAAAAAIREAGGILHERVSRVCDYFVTDRHDLAQDALSVGAKRVINTLEQKVMTGTRD